MTIVLSIGGIAGPVTAAAHAAGAASILFSIIDAPQPHRQGIKNTDACSEDIVFQNVNFAYPARYDVKVLDNLSLTFPARKVTAIVGPSGSGKSTIVGLLERWYELDGNLTDNAIVSLSSDHKTILIKFLDTFLQIRQYYRGQPKSTRDRSEVMEITNWTCSAGAFPFQRYYIEERRIWISGYGMGAWNPKAKEKAG